MAGLAFRNSTKYGRGINSANNKVKNENVYLSAFHVKAVYR